MELDETIQKTFLKLIGAFCCDTMDFKQHVKLTSKLTFLVDDCTEYEYNFDHMINRSEKHVYKSRFKDMECQTDSWLLDLEVQTDNTEDMDNTSDYAERLVIKEEQESVTDDASDTEVITKSMSTSPSSPVGESMKQLKEEEDTDKLSSDPQLRESHDIGNIFICTLCKDPCVSNAALMQHMEDEHGKENETVPRRKSRTRKCSIKKIEITEKIKIDVNKEKVNNKIKESLSKYSCDVCGEEFRSKRTMYHHKRTHKEDAPAKYVCDVCREEFSSKRTMCHHKRKHKEDIKLKTPSEYVCDVCGKKFKARRTMYYHKRLHKEEPKVYTCTEPGCGAVFNHSHSYKIHKLKHAGARPFQCNFCEKNYFTSYNLRLHVQGVHAEKKNYTCKTCGKHFSYPTSLRAHELLHEEGPRVNCQECDKTFVHNQALQYHMRTIHSEPGIHKCEECNKKFKSDVILQRHKRRHTSDAKRFMCDICARQFMFKSDLESHKIYHRDEKKFVCKICGKAFKAYPTLYYHTFVHKEETPYQCAECGKAFKTKERCKAHERRHSNVKPFECEICHRCFLNKVELNKHKTSVHASIKKFVCSLCGKAMARADNLKAHLKLHENPEYKPRQSRKTKNTEEIMDYDSPKIVPENLIYGDHKGMSKLEDELYNDTSRESVASSSGDRNHFTNSDMYQPNMPHFSSIDSPHLSVQPEEQNMPLNLHHPNPSSSNFQLLNIGNSVPQISTSVSSAVPPSCEPLPILQQAHYMYPRPYMYPAGMQPQAGGFNRFFQQ